MKQGNISVLEVPYCNLKASSVHGRWTRFRERICIFSHANGGGGGCGGRSGRGGGGGSNWYGLEICAVESRVCEFSFFNFFLVNISISLFCESFTVFQRQQSSADNLGNSTDDICSCDKF